MAKPQKVLFITQEIMPYVPASSYAIEGRMLPAAVQDQKVEIRTFMPKWGNVNERRNQLHEVIRLSGMNIIIDDTDHPLILKVASIQAARMQIYFIDSDDYFMKRLGHADEKGVEYEDNGERAVFYARGVLETVKKLRWVPDVIHCHGWISSVVPFYVKRAYNEEPSFANTKVVTSLFKDDLKKVGDNFRSCVPFRDANAEALKDYPEIFTPADLQRLAIEYSDAAVIVENGVSRDVQKYLKERDIPVIKKAGEDYTNPYFELYDKLLS
ncbi:MAG: glycogen/starch synthase [Bacteroidaceae bacterium]|nr:glycogen/starch synthase [Bacteroidaceae bacterium]